MIIDFLFSLMFGYFTYTDIRDANWGWFIFDVAFLSIFTGYTISNFRKWKGTQRVTKTL